MAFRTLYRPVGIEELRLIRSSGRFPPRLAGQPIFYPVLSFEYAEQIARDWNAADDRAGFVTEFDIDAGYVSKFEEHVVGARIHRELWVPAEELEDFNRHIIGAIRLVSAYYGVRYKGERPAL